MNTTVFISHAGADWSAVANVVSRLQEYGLHIRLDRHELELGDSFLRFMEEALASCDYCLLLWSAAAAQSKWVRVEWEAAFHRTVSESQRFLIIGMLESHAVPELLRPRLRIDLFPDPAPGVAKLVELWHNDRTAQEASQRPLCNPKCAITVDVTGSTVYISSKLFAKTFPIRLDLGVPTAVAVDRIVSDLGLPRQIDQDGKIGLRFQYYFALGEQRLKSEQPLNVQHVEDNVLLWLETEMQPFAQTAPVSGGITTAVFRGGRVGMGARSAFKILLPIVSQIGLGP
jgi:hypothetical protein